ncbi:MAG: apolipoprotein N-acyltransferase [Arenimonas sp.]
MTWLSRTGLQRLAGIVLSASLFGLYARGGYGYVLGFIVLVPWLLALNSIPTLAGALRNAWVMSILFVAMVFAWFGVAIGAYTGIGSLTGLLVVLVTAPLLQPQLLAFALIRHCTARRYGPVVRALAGASAWVATEWLYPKLLGDTMGHGLYPSLYLRQFADVGGAAGLTFILILVNECIAHAIVHRRDAVRVLIKPLLLALCLPILIAGYGAACLSSLTTVPEPEAKPLRIGMVQSNITGYERLRREMGAYEVVRHVLDTHYAMSRDAIKNNDVDALLWSETVYPTTFASPKSEGGAELDKEILDFVTVAKVPLVFGTYDRDESGEYNAAAFVEPLTGTLGFYRKTDLFLLTEYLPPWLDGRTARGLLPWAGSWKPGSGARVFPLRLADGREIPVLPMICLDDVNTDLAIDGSRLGAQLILGMSNDSWFTEYPVGANLHLTVAAFRSIETRLPQMRVTSNGISAVIDATGAIVASTAMNERKLLVGEVYAREPAATLMVAWGDWVGRAGLAFLVLLALFFVVDFLKQRSTSTSANSASNVQEDFRADGAVLSSFWRVMLTVLRLVASAGLCWIGKIILFGDSAQTNSLTQISMFAGLVLAPTLAAWSIMRACSAKLHIQNDMLVLEQRERRIEIALKDIAAIHLWKLPLPGTGINLQLESGKRWSQSITIADPSALISALIHAGASPALAQAPTPRLAAYWRARVAVPHWRMDHPLMKFFLFPLVPALPAFRLHQNIAFGGTFGEYYTYGLKAYLIAFGIWWASWIIGMVLFAAALRILIEATALLSAVLRPERAIDARSWLELLGRVFFFIGVPAWLLIHILPN